MGIGKRVVGAVISKPHSPGVIPELLRIQSEKSSSRGPVTGSNLKISLDTAIKQQDDGENETDDNRWSGKDAC